VIRPLLCAVIAVLVGADHGHAQQAAGARAPEARVELPSERAVQTMLWLADAGAGDLVYSLGCGDGRVALAAARRFGARAVCVDAGRARILGAREAARRAGVADRVRFVDEDVLATRIGDATVAILTLSPAHTLKLRPRILRELKPGARVVSYAHAMGDWKPDLTVHVGSGDEERAAHLWIVPAR
jgi:SAM-dependent methyltransferase